MDARTLISNAQYKWLFTLIYSSISIRQRNDSVSSMKWCHVPGAGGGVHPLLPQTHQRHRGHALQHELHQQQPDQSHRRALHAQRGRRHQGQEGQVQKVVWLPSNPPATCHPISVCVCVCFSEASWSPSLIKCVSPTASCSKRRSSSSLIPTTGAETHLEMPPLSTGDSSTLAHLQSQQTTNTRGCTFNFVLKSVRDQENVTQWMWIGIELLCISLWRVYHIEIQFLTNYIHFLFFILCIEDLFLFIQDQFR